MPIGSIVGGLIGQGGANTAAGYAGQAAKNADFIRVLNEAKLSPWVQTGWGAQDLITRLLGIGRLEPDGQGHGGARLNASNWQGDQQNALTRFQPSPDYQFRFGEGLKALDRSAASRGSLFSGAQMKGAQQYGGDLASGEYNNWFNKLLGQSGMGLNATNTGVNSNLQATGMQNNALMAQGGLYQQGSNALASGIGNAFSNAAALFGRFGGGIYGSGAIPGAQSPGLRV